MGLTFLILIVPITGSFEPAIGQQRGPVISRMIMHKLHEGDIDGFTLVYSALIGEWKKLTEVNVLKEAISKIAQEEQAGNNEH